MYKKYTTNVGDEFHSLTVIDLNPALPAGIVRCGQVLCKCACGNLRVVPQTKLHNKITKSCGCKKNIYAQIKVGDPFNRWTITNTQVPQGGGYVEVRCSCGTVAVVNRRHLVVGNSKSCGCWGKEAASNRATHGHTKNGVISLTYATWADMRRRCENPKNQAYKYYGERGIRVCERWQTFENFLADMGERTEGKVIDRENPNGHYEPGNCKWVTKKESARNKRNT